MTDPRYGGMGFTETLVSSAARTVSGDSGTIGGWGRVSTLRAQLDVTAVAGVSPTLNVVIEDTLDGTNWNALTPAFTQRTAAGREVINITTPFSGNLRIRWTVGGTTPSFTFSVAVFYE